MSLRSRASQSCDPLTLVVPPPQVRAALQVHAAQPTVDAAGSDPVLLAGQHSPTGIGELHRPLKWSAVGNPSGSKREQRRGGARQSFGECRYRSVGDVVDVFTV